MAKKYIFPKILVVDMASEELILDNSKYATGDNITYYGITGGGWANEGQDTESKKRNTLFDLPSGSSSDDEW